MLAITPGPGVIYLVTRTLGQGRRAGLASIGGVALGNLGNALLACLGLEVVLAASSAAFTVLKLAGAAYLVWLGLRELRRPPAPRESAAPLEAAPGRAFRDGVFVALLNPKTTLFYAAFLPQFIDPRAAAPLVRSIELAAAFVAIAACTDTLYVLAAGALRSRMRVRPNAWGRRLSALLYLALGTYLAVSDVRPAR